MKFSNRTNIFYGFAFSILIIGKSAHANPEAPSISGRSTCGDYTILKKPADRAILERYCGTNKEEDFELLYKIVNRLDPANEAHAAARRGDFRLAATTAGGPPDPERKRSWYLRGVKCEKIKDADVFIWIRLSDALTGALNRYEGSMVAFSKKYNSTMISEKHFPKNMGCSLD